MSIEPNNNPNNEPIRPTHIPSSNSSFNSDFIYNKKILLARQMSSGAGWFLTIAILSLVNTVISLLGSQTTFLLGLGITQLIDIITYNFSSTIRLIGIVINLVIASIFFIFSRQAKKGRSWAFITGFILYIIDSLIFIVFQDWLPVAFHILALVYIFKGLLSSKKFNKIIAEEKFYSNNM